MITPTDCSPLIPEQRTDHARCARHRTSFCAARGFERRQILARWSDAGIALAVLLGCSTAMFYFLRLNGPGMPAAAHAGGAGAVIALLASPSLIVALLLVFIIPAYVMVGLMIGRAAPRASWWRAMDGLAQRLAEMLAQRVESMPRAHKALHKTADLLSASTAVEQLKPWVGDGRAVQWVVRTVLNRLPLADLVDEWSHTRAEWGTEAARTTRRCALFWRKNSGPAARHGRAAMDVAVDFDGRAPCGAGRWHLAHGLRFFLSSIAANPATQRRAWQPDRRQPASRNACRRWQRPARSWPGCWR